MLNSFARCRDEGLSNDEVSQLRLCYGRNLPPDTPKRFDTRISTIMFDVLLANPVALALWVAAIVHGSIQNFAGMGIIFGIQLINVSVSLNYPVSGRVEVNKPVKARATCKRQGQWVHFDTAELVPGDLVLLTRGAQIQADCYINEGQLEVDQSSVTGASLPVKLRQGDLCMC